MHICLPDSQEVKLNNQRSIVFYNLHINGLFYCRLRFKQLLHLHQSLARRLKSSNVTLLPPFPSKKLLSLSAAQIEIRRQQLEKYLQTIVQDKTIANSCIFNLFLSEAQRESTIVPNTQTQLYIELVNGQKIRIQIMTHDSLSTVLASACRVLGLKDACQAYFCLCLCSYDVISDKLIVKRRFSFFEAPYITLQMANQQQQQIQQALQQQQKQQYQQQLSSSSSSTSARPNQTSSRSSAMYCDCDACLVYTNNSSPQSSSSSTSSASSGSSQESSCPSSSITMSAASSLTSSSACKTAATPTSRQRVHCLMAMSKKQTIEQPTARRTTKSTFVTHQILLRKSYWDPLYDTHILSDCQALNLLFIQTVYDVKHCLMFVDMDTYQQLEALLAANAKLDYILLARTLKYYNYVHFEPCQCDFPEPNSKVLISIGSRELNMRVLKPINNVDDASSRPSSSSSSSQVGYFKEDFVVAEEYNFKVPLIKCWRLTSLETLNTISGGSGGQTALTRRPSQFDLLSSATKSLYSHLKLNGQQQQQQPTSAKQAASGNGIDSYQTCRSTPTISSKSQSLNSTTATATGQKQQRRRPQAPQAPSGQYELSFEYLVAKDTLKWVTIASGQAIFISISLQGVVDELVAKRDNEPFKGSASVPEVQQLDLQQSALTYMRHDGTLRPLSLRSISFETSHLSSAAAAAATGSVSCGSSSSNQNSRSALLAAGASSSATARQITAWFTGPSSAVSSSYLLNNGRRRQSKLTTTSLDLTSLKKGRASPIINDAFEGEYNDEDI